MPTAAVSTALAPGERVCVIGAGCAGLTTTKALAARGVPVDCYEKGSALGGNWRYGNDNGQSAVYRSLHINSSKWKMQFADFPLPADFPDYGHHSDVLRYFEAYAEHFGITPLIQFRTEVRRVEPDAAGWAVTLRDADGREVTRRYGAVAVCNGHHWHPRLPEFPGGFDGEAIHAHDYRRPDAYTGKRVLVVGIGNSAVDIAADLARIADGVTLSTRSGAWIVPKYVLGRPVDHWASRGAERLPLWARERLYRALVYLTAGNQLRYGMPTPPHGMLAAHPTINQEFLSDVGHGRLKIKPNVAELAGTEVVFEDGTRARFDAIIYATGYHISFPFLPPAVFAARDNHVALYRGVAEPAAPGLYFIGLLQPIGSIMPLAELQGRWVAGLAAGDWILPDVATMRRAIADDAVAVARRYRASPRHTIQVDFWTYVKQVEREMKHGADRAARAHVRPLPHAT